MRVILFSVVAVAFTISSSSDESSINVIHKIAQKLRVMHEEVKAEQEADTKLFQKQECECKTFKEEIPQKIQNEIAGLQTNEEEYASLTSSINGLASEIKDLKDAVAQSEDAISSAQAQRKKENDYFKTESSEHRNNIEGVKKAITVLAKHAEKWSMLQMQRAPWMNSLKRIAMVSSSITDEQRHVIDSLVEFSSGESMETGDQHEILGVLRTILDTLTQELASMESTEAQATKDHNRFVASMTSVVQGNKEHILAKTQSQAEMRVRSVDLKNQIKMTEDAIGDMQAAKADKFAACATLEETYHQKTKDRHEEMAVIMEAHNFLDNPKNYEAFSKVKVNHEVSFIQRPHTALLSVGKADFSKVIKMVQGMIRINEERSAEEARMMQKCAEDKHAKEDSVKDNAHLQNTISTELKSASENLSSQQAGLEEVTSNIATFQKNMARATEDREANNKAFLKSMHENQQAVRIIQGATNILARKFGAGKSKRDSVMSIMNLMKKVKHDVEITMSELQKDEQHMQAQYEQNQAANVKSVNEFKNLKTAADLEIARLQSHIDTKQAELQDAKKVGDSMKGELAELITKMCVDHLDKDAVTTRIGEFGAARDMMKRAIAVLKGADDSTEAESFLQFSEDPKETSKDLNINYAKIAPFGKEDTAHELQKHAAKTQDTLVDAVENAEVSEIKRSVFRSLTRLRAATIKEFDTIARLETQAIDAYNDAHHYRAENPLTHLHDDEAPVPADKLKSFH